jgi:bifunctional DNA-binding transcriptional regulator/antitoxin component of YhaV-PrlF toxin-antitoxin module
LPVSKVAAIIRPLPNRDAVVDEQAMETTVVTADGEIVLPHVFRDALNWAPGTRLSLELAPGGLLLKEAPVFAPTSLEALFGSMQYAGSALSIEDMRTAVKRDPLQRGRAGS